MYIKKQRQYFTNKGPSSQSLGFSSSQVWMWELDYKESWAPKNQCFWTVVLEKTLESPLDCKEIQLVHPRKIRMIFLIFPENQDWFPLFQYSNIHWKDWCWSWNSNTLAISREELIHWKRPWCWEGLGAGGEGDDRGWVGWMASPTRRTWVWVNSGR